MLVCFKKYILERYTNREKIIKNNRPCIKRFRNLRGEPTDQNYCKQQTHI